MFDRTMFDRRYRVRVPYLPEVFQKLLKTYGILKASKFLKERKKKIFVLFDCVRVCSNASCCATA